MEQLQQYMEELYNSMGIRHHLDELYNSIDDILNGSEYEEAYNTPIFDNDEDLFEHLSKDAKHN